MKPRRLIGWLGTGVGPALALGIGACASPGAHPALPPGHPPLQEPEATEASWSLYRSDGTPASLDELLAAALEVDVLFVGERHGDPGAHRFQLELLTAALDRAERGGRPSRPILSLEMFERDVQLAVDEYLAGLVTEDHFLAAARPWENYRRDYRPVVELARERGIPIVAANPPRRYVNLVSRLGPDALADLPEGALAFLPPLPFPGPSERYRAEWDANMEEAGGHAMSDHVLYAQALWDAGMGHAIDRALDGGEGEWVLHLTGAFHVENRTGTPEALEHYRPDGRSLVVTVQPVDDPGAFDPERFSAVADFVVLTRRALLP